MSSYLQSLNDVQRQAVENFQGPALIVAGAGSGKTRVLTCRIAYMLEKGVPPAQILALTFTNKAAKEMRARIHSLLPSGAARNLWVGTFHSIFARILRTEAELVGFPPTFTIYDSSDSKNLIKLIIKELKLDEEKYKPNTVATRISMAKNNLVTADAYAASTSLQAADREQRIPAVVDIYRLYSQKCRNSGAMDFDDLLLYINILFRDHPETLAKYQEMFPYLLVDEYQDTNVAQYLIVQKLAARSQNVCVVGDDAQSIYSFRGAKIENILRFQNDFPQAKLFKLEQNYRSTQTIVNAANSIIAKNSRQIPKTAFSKAAMGERIKVLKAYTDREEASLIGSDIYATVRNNQTPYQEFAILYRTNAQSRALEDALKQRSIPYRIYGGQSFYQRKVIKDLLGYLRLVLNPADNEAFLRIINTPTRGIGDVTINHLSAAAQKHGLSLWATVSTLPPQEWGVGGAACKRVEAFVKLIGSLGEARSTMEAYEFGLEVATRSGLIGSYKSQNTPEALSALENIEELINSIREFTELQQREAELSEEGNNTTISIDEWIQNIALLTDMDTEESEEQSQVTLMTVHAAKGLEFEYVYVAGLEENLFPSMMSLGAPENLEEERRLFYVALTRAKCAAILTCADSRFKWGQMTPSRPSRFLGEIDESYLDADFDIKAACNPDSALSTATSQGSYEGRSGTAGGYSSTRREGQVSWGGRVGATRNPSGAGAGGSSSKRYPQRGTYSAHTHTPQQSTPRPDARFRSLESRTHHEPTRYPTSTPTSSPTQGTQSFQGGHAQGAHPQGAQPQGVQPQGGAEHPYSVGTRVEHAKFGVGKIVATEVWSNDVKLTVEFAGAGRKVLLQKFAKLSILR